MQYCLSPWEDAKAKVASSLVIDVAQIKALVLHNLVCDNPIQERECPFTIESCLLFPRLSVVDGEKLWKETEWIVFEILRVEKFGFVLLIFPDKPCKGLIIVQESWIQI